MSPLSAWAEDRPKMSEADRTAIAVEKAVHLPVPDQPVQVSDADLDAMKAAFIRRFNEDLPRTETLMGVAHVGYRMALRDRVFGRVAKPDYPTHEWIDGLDGVDVADVVAQLLEALEDSLPELVALLTHLEEAPELEGKIAKVRAAITKARGEA